MWLSHNIASFELNKLNNINSVIRFDYFILGFSILYVPNHCKLKKEEYYIKMQDLSTPFEKRLVADHMLLLAHLLSAKIKILHHSDLQKNGIGSVHCFLQSMNCHRARHPVF